MIPIPLIQSDSIDFDNLLKKWEKIKDKVENNPTYRDITLRAWRRCEKHQVDPSNLEYVYLSEEEFKEKLKENKDLIESAEPYMENLSLGLVETPHVLGLSDNDNWLLSGAGTQEILEQETDIRPGVNLSEKYVGNNGNGTPLVEGNPVLIYDCEHFGEQNYSTSCFGVPIRGADNQIRGVLNISIPTQFASPEKLLIMLSSANSIEKELGQKNNEIELSYENVGKIIKNWRNKRNLTQKQLARKAELAQSYISDIENENKCPTLRSLQFIGDALEINLFSLLKSNNEKEA